MNEHRARVAMLLRDLDSRAKLLFGLLMADRLRGCCFVACHKSGVFHSYASTIERLFEMTYEQGNIDIDIICKDIEALQELVPEGGEPLEVQGQSSVICLLESLRLASSEDLDAANDLVNSMIDALDNFAFFVRRSITGQSVSPNDYMLLQRELQREIDDLEFVSNSTILQVDIIERRVENQQFAIPIAVGDFRQE